MNNVKTTQIGCNCTCATSHGEINVAYKITPTHDTLVVISKEKGYTETWKQDKELAILEASKFFPCLSGFLQNASTKLH